MSDNQYTAADTGENKTVPITIPAMAPAASLDPLDLPEPLTLRASAHRTHPFKTMTDASKYTKVVNVE